MHAWTRDELLALARGKLVGVRGELGEPVVVPDWMRSDEFDVLDQSIEEILDQVHPDDRVNLVDLYGLAMTTPGELLDTEFRSTLGESAAITRMQMINLIGDDVLGHLFVVIDPTGRVVDGGFDHDHLFDQRPADWMIFTVNSAAVIMTVEGDSERFIGYSHDELIGSVPAKFTVAEHLVAGIRMWKQLNEHPEGTYTSRRQWIRKDGTRVWVETSYAHRRNPPSGEGHIILVLWDITDKVAAEQQLLEREAELQRLADDFRALANEVTAAVFRCTIDGDVTFHNAAWRQLLDRRAGVERIHDLFDGESRRRLDTTLADLIVGQTERVELELAGDDETTWWRLRLRAIGGDGRAASFIGSLDDITTTAKLRVEARHDSLTGLLNRSAIEAHLAQALATSGSHTIVVFVDLDRFKVVNDTWGHEAGDAVLVEVAHRLRRAAREHDAIGRWGGDELLLVMDVGAEPDDHRIVERLQRVLLKPVAVNETADWIPSASIGVIRPEPGESAETVIARADAAMFAVKRATR
ncbi:MAG: diguanylate cyclase [Acidimicrobiales bacterium]